FVASRNSRQLGSLDENTSLYWTIFSSSTQTVHYCFFYRQKSTSSSSIPFWHRKALYFVRCEMRPRKYYLKTTTKRKKLNVKIVPIRASPRLPAGKWTLSIDS